MARANLLTCRAVPLLLAPCVQRDRETHAWEARASDEFATKQDRLHFQQQRQCTQLSKTNEQVIYRHEREKEKAFNQYAAGARWSGAGARARVACLLCLVCAGGAVVRRRCDALARAADCARILVRCSLCASAQAVYAL